jgi:mRNA interferase MazF
VNVNDWKAAGLLKASVVKPVLTTIEATLVVRALGHLKEGDQQALKQALKSILG